MEPLLEVLFVFISLALEHDGIKKRVTGSGVIAMSTVSAFAMMKAPASWRAPAAIASTSKVATTTTVAVIVGWVRRVPNHLLRVGVWVGRWVRRHVAVSWRWWRAIATIGRPIRRRVGVRVGARRRGAMIRRLEMSRRWVRRHVGRVHGRGMGLMSHGVL